MDDVTALLEEALEHHQLGELKEAEGIYQRILAADPENGETHYLLGTALLQLGRLEESVLLLTKVVALRPDLADASNNLGIACDALGRPVDAVRHFETALRTRPDYEQAAFNLAALHERLGDSAAAEKRYRDLLSFHPHDVAAWFRLGNVLKVQGRFSEAEQSYRQVLDRDPNDLDAKVNLGAVLTSQRKLRDAARIYDDVIDASPEYYQVHANLSHVHELLGESQAALAAAKRSVSISPDYAEGWNNLGMAFRSAHRLEDSIAAFRNAYDLAPEFPLARFNLAAALLFVENYREGWPHYAASIEALNETSSEQRTLQWTGETLIGKRLLISADQGLGDTLQFARFLPAAGAQSQATVAFACQPKLCELLAGCAGADVVISTDAESIQADAFLPLASLPAVLGVDANSLGGVPYIRSRAAFPARLKSVFDTDELKVGLAWQGNPNNLRDAERSCPFAALRPLFTVPGVKFVILQEGEAGRRQLDEAFPAGLPENLIDACAELPEFATMAAVMTQLDLIITIDTSIAHLAGALGCPVWTMLCYTPDWRWQLDRADSPWYLTMRMFRQPRWGAWDAVVQDVAAALNEVRRSGTRV